MAERSVFYLLMKMFVTSSHLQLKSSTQLLIMKVSPLSPVPTLSGQLKNIPHGSAEQQVPGNTCQIQEVP